MFPQRSHFNGGKSLLSSSTSPCKSEKSKKRMFGSKLICRFVKTNLSLFPSVFSHISVSEFYVSHPIRRSIKRLTAHITSQRRVLLFFDITILICTVDNFLQNHNINCTSFTFDIVILKTEFLLTGLISIS